MKARILSIDDDNQTRELVRAAFEEEGCTVLTADTLAAGLELAKEQSPHLIVLDLMLPDGNGLDLCDKIRRNRILGLTPIIALTGKAELRDKMDGFNRGIDQYLIKPIEMEELVLWAKALLRRVELAKGAVAAVTSLGDVQLIPEARLLKFRNVQVNGLTSREYEIFSALLKSSPKILSRKAILLDIWKTVAVPNLIDTHIFNLRRKLPKELANRIQAVPGQGFRYFHSGGAR